MRKALNFVLALAVVLSFAAPVQGLIRLDGWVLPDKNAQGNFENFVVKNVGTQGALVVMVGYYLPDRGMSWADVADFTLAINETKVLRIGENTQEGPSFYQQRYENLRIVVLTSDGITHPIKMRPRANFSFTVENNVVRFYDKSTDADGTIMRWFWDFGDNATSNQQNPIHVYPSGVFTATLTVWDDDNLSDSCSKVIAPPFAFSLSVTPSSASISPGGNATATVSVTLVSGTPALVALSATSLPSGASVSFTPSSGTPSFNSTMNISTSSNTPTGSYTITIVGISGDIVQTTSYILYIAAGGGSGSPGAWISGRVVDYYNTWLPLPGVTVTGTVTNPGSGGWYLYIPAGASSGSDGRFSIRIVAISYGTSSTSWGATFTFSKDGWNSTSVSCSGTATYESPNLIISPSDLGTIQMRKADYGTFDWYFAPGNPPSSIRVFFDGSRWKSLYSVTAKVYASGSYSAPISFSALYPYGVSMYWDPSSIPYLVDPTISWVTSGSQSVYYTETVENVPPNTTIASHLFANGATGYSRSKQWDLTTYS